MSAITREVYAYRRVEYNGRTYNVTIYKSAEADVRQLTKRGDRLFRARNNTQKCQWWNIVRLAIRAGDFPYPA
jgi:hypothetical protein